MNINLSSENKEIFHSLLLSNRLPQSIILEGGDEESRKDAAEFLAIWSVCSSDTENKPCGTCSNCIKAIKDSHSDIFIPKTEGKTNIIPIKKLREEIIPETSIIPNEADAKVFIFYDADKTLSEDCQNTLLKTIEEPPQKILFIFTAEKANSLLITIRSRSQIFTLKNEDNVDEYSDEIATNILRAILDTKEIPLLYATTLLTTKDKVKEIIPIINEYLSKAISMSVGNKTDNELSSLLAKKLSKAKLLSLVEANGEIIKKANTNINNNILNTYICTTYRRIAWRK